MAHSPDAVDEEGSCPKLLAANWLGKSACSFDSRRLHYKPICDSSQVGFFLALTAIRRAKKQSRKGVSGLILLTLTPVSVDFDDNRLASDTPPNLVRESFSVIVPHCSE